MNKDFSGNRFCLYLHIRPDIGTVFYVGIGTRGRPSKTDGRNKHWRNIVAKNNGKFIVEILCDNILRDTAALMEIRLISHYGRIDIGTGTLCNMTNGGDGTVNISKESINRRKQKMAELRKTPEYQKKISDAQRGRIVSEECRNKISKKLKGRIISAEARRNMGLVKVGLVLSDDALTSRFISVVRNRGWVVDQIDKTTNQVLQTFASQQAASDAVGMSNGVIISSLKGKQGRSPYRWERNYNKEVIEKVLESYTVPLKIEAA